MGESEANAKRVLSCSSNESTPQPPHKMMIMENATDLGPRLQEAVSASVTMPPLNPVDVSQIVTSVVAAILPIIMQTVQVSMKQAIEESVRSSDRDIGRLEDKLLNQAWRIDANEQYSRRENIRISGVDLPPEDVDNPPSTTNEIVVDTCKKMGVEITDQDISTSHWLPGRKPTIIAKFVRRDTKAEIMQKKNTLKKDDPKIFEDLTRARRELLMEIKSDPNVLRAFTRDGIIHCILVDPDDRRKEIRVRIKDPKDLLKLGWCDDDIRWLHNIFD